MPGKQEFADGIAIQALGAVVAATRLSGLGYSSKDTYKDTPQTPYIQAAT